MAFLPWALCSGKQALEVTDWGALTKGKRFDPVPTLDGTAYLGEGGSPATRFMLCAQLISLLG